MPSQQESSFATTFFSVFKVGSVTHQHSVPNWLPQEKCSLNRSVGSQVAARTGAIPKHVHNMKKDTKFLDILYEILQPELSQLQELP